MTPKKMAAALSAALGAAGALAVPPVVSDVTLVQPAGTRVAQVGYTIDSPGIATFQFKTGGVDVCHSEIASTATGDINMYIPAAGTYSFTWDAKRDFPEQLVSNLTVEVTLWAVDNPPVYCAVKLVQENGLYPIYWYGKESEVPLGVTNSIYKKDWLLMRQIPSTQGKDVTLGSPLGETGRTATSETNRSVRITKPFYLGVYEVTQLQYVMVMGTNPSVFTNKTVYEERPVQYVTWNNIRGSAGSGYDWPNNGHAVDMSASFMGRLRTRTGGMIEFDLPTDAQWEYACRAGTTGAWNNGTTSINSESDVNLDLLGRYEYNGGYIQTSPGTFAAPDYGCTDEYGTAKVGSYLPNAWGLYDMHGNVWEWCLDWFVNGGPALMGDDPEGPVTGSNRVRRGGGWSSAASNNRSARRGEQGPSSTAHYTGFRIAAPAKVTVTP